MLVELASCIAGGSKRLTRTEAVLRLCERYPLLQAATAMHLAPRRKAKDSNIWRPQSAFYFGGGPKVTSQ